MSATVIHAKTEAETERLGQLLAELLPDGAVVALEGTLGAGKTRLVQAVARACGVRSDEALSPTFMLVHEYVGTRSIAHFDAYRLADDDEFLALGPDEYFESSRLCFVEWADRVQRCLPGERLEIRIDETPDGGRRFEFRAAGVPLERVAREVAARWTV